MAPEETPEFLQESLRKFHSEVTKVKNKPAYDRAQELLLADPKYQDSYIHASGYKLRFLRCELFNICKAAKRYCKYLDTLLELHGEKALKGPIGISDLGREEMTFLREGSIQVMPYRDRSGRRVVCVVPNSRRDVPRQVVLKIWIYISASLVGSFENVNNDLDHLETQVKGAIVIIMPSYHHVYENRGLEGSLNWTRRRLEAAQLAGLIVPVRACAVHLCYPNTALAKAVASIFTIVGSSRLSMVKFHFGNPIELRYQLQGYGIPTDLIPSTDTGNVKSVNLKQWMKLRKYLEWRTQEIKTMWESEESDESSLSLEIRTFSQIVECPASNDVLFRRGRAMNYHPGNVKFLNLIESRIHEHTFDETTTPFRRTVIEKELMQQIRDSGGRFVKWDIDKGWWVDMTIAKDDGTAIDASREIDREIQSKIHYAFRDFRKKMMKTRQQPIVNTSSTHVFQLEDGLKRRRYDNDTSTSQNCNFEGLWDNHCDSWES